MFYLGGDSQLMAVPVSSDTEFASETPLMLFSIGSVSDTFGNYDVSADGQHFVVISPSPGAIELPTVLINWMAALPGD